MRPRRAPTKLLLVALVASAGMTLTESGKDHRTHCHNWLRSLSAVTLNSGATGGASADEPPDSWRRRSEHFLRHYFGADWIPSQNPTALAPALTCENREGSGCLYDEEFFKLYPDACRLLKKDEDWPVWEPNPRTPDVIGGGELYHLLRGAGAKLVMQGVSLVRQTEAALQCSMMRETGERVHTVKQVVGSFSAGTTHRSRFWTTFSNCSDEAQLAAQFDTAAQERCLGNDGSFDAALAKEGAKHNRTIVVMSYHHDHYNWPHRGIPEEANMTEAESYVERFALYERDVRYAVERARAHGYGFILMTTTAPHFFGKGSYDHQVYFEQVQLKGECQCSRSPDYEQSLSFYFRQRLLALGQELGVPVIDTYWATLERYFAHKGLQCSVANHLDTIEERDWEQFKAWLNGTRGTPEELLHARRSRPKKEIRGDCCDCVHWCYTPLFWDREVVTPLVKILREMLQ